MTMLLDATKFTSEHKPTPDEGAIDATIDTIQIVIADDHPLVRTALRQALSTGIPGVAIREAHDLASLGATLRCGEPVDLVLLDLAMPGVSGFSGLLYLRSQHPEIPVVIVSATEEHTIMRRCIEVGAAGYIPKSTEVETMRDAIRVVLAGEIWTPCDLDMVLPPDTIVADMMRRLSNLTPQQLRVLMMLTQGLLNKQIAYELKVSEATVKAHVSAILQKLAVDSRTQAVIAVSKIDQAVSARTAERRPKPPPRATSPDDLPGSHDGAATGPYLSTMRSVARGPMPTPRRSNDGPQP